MATGRTECVIGGACGISCCPSTVSRTVSEPKRVDFQRAVSCEPKEEERKHTLSECRLSGPLNRLNATLSLLHPLDRTPSAIGSAIGRPLSRPISHPNTGGSPQPPRSKPLAGLNRAIVVL